MNWTKQTSPVESSKSEPSALSRRTLFARAVPLLAGAGVLSAFPVPVGGRAKVTLPEGSGTAKISSSEYWAKNGDLRLAMFRKCSEAPEKATEPRPVLFLAHGSSVSSRPSFDLKVPGHDDYSLMDQFAAYGFDVWTMDFQGYGRSSQGSGNSDIASETKCRHLAEPGLPHAQINKLISTLLAFETAPDAAVVPHLAKAEISK